MKSHSAHLQGYSQDVSKLCQNNISNHFISLGKLGAVKGSQSRGIVPKKSLMVCDKVKAVWTECSLSDASVRHRLIGTDSPTLVDTFAVEKDLCVLLPWIL